MRIAWIADFNVNTRFGGAQLTNHYVIQEGRIRGHRIDELGLYNLTDTDRFMAGYDLYIINNFTEIAKHTPGRNLLEFIVKHKQYVKYAHDYDYSIDESEDFGEFKRKLYKQALFVAVLSPLHLEQIRNAYGCEKMITVPSYIDTDLFKNRGIKRMKDTIIGLGEIGEHKGIYNVMKYAENNPDKRVDFYCFNAKDEFKYLDNMRFLPAIKYDILPIYLNMYESFIHLPEWKEPFGRTVAEAMLSGCKMIINDNIGFLSYKLTDDLRLFLESGPTVFWEAVRRSTNNIL